MVFHVVPTICRRRFISFFKMIINRNTWNTEKEVLGASFHKSAQKLPAALQL